MRILGIDPGFALLGWAVVEHSLTIVDFGVVRTEPCLKIEERLLEVHRSLDMIVKEYRPESASLEKLFFSRNTTTAIDVAKSIGVILLTLKMSGLDYAEYTPSQVKQAVTGYGKASKAQMQKMIMKIFGLQETPPDDAADALAVAACHALGMGNKAIALHAGK